jgi:DNA-binding PadR family transcriptional regulator
MPSRDPNDLLPLPTAWFHILVALGEGERHGYSIMQDVAARTHGKLRIGPGTLYAALKRLAGEGLVQECDDPSGADERRRVYRITRFGRVVALAEMTRMEMLVRQAKAHLREA